MSKKDRHTATNVMNSDKRLQMQVNKAKVKYKQACSNQCQSMSDNDKRLQNACKDNR